MYNILRFNKNMMQITKVYLIKKHSYIHTVLKSMDQNWKQWNIQKCLVNGICIMTWWNEHNEDCCLFQHFVRKLSVLHLSFFILFFHSSNIQDIITPNENFSKIACLRSINIFFCIGKLWTEMSFLKQCAVLRYSLRKFYI